MIKVKVSIDSEEKILGIDLNGHSGYEEYGRDIICASVSALTLNMANSVEAFTKDGFDGSIEEETGGFHFRFTGEISQESKLLMDSLILGLKSIEETYGEKYIKIRFEEV